MNPVGLFILACGLVIGWRLFVTNGLTGDSADRRAVAPTPRPTPRPIPEPIGKPIRT